MSQSTGTKPAFEVKLPRQSAKTRPTPEEIRQRAYEIYLSHDGAAGDELQDWLQAESELQAKKS
ncbi:MAG TPA: DUF2934 domain-containing protein [Candidatus Acidoferrum sp.]|nr:DUF2934 domain-containing protein [Candidatus Acidoferrum sp.]